MKLNIILLSLLILTCGCSKSGPPTTNTSSSNFSSLAEKVAFLEKYVTFKRSYTKLDFIVHYLNGGGWVPGPSEWTVCIIAQVPSDQLELWTSNHTAIEKPDDLTWLNEVTTSIDYSSLSKWYRTGRITVATDPNNSIIVYRNVTF